MENPGPEGRDTLTRDIMWSCPEMEKQKTEKASGHCGCLAMAGAILRLQMFSTILEAPHQRTATEAVGTWDFNHKRGKEDEIRT